MSEKHGRVWDADDVELIKSMIFWGFTALLAYQILYAVLHKALELFWEWLLAGTSAQRNRHLRHIVARETEVKIREEAVEGIEAELEAREDRLECFEEANRKELLET